MDLTFNLYRSEAGKQRLVDLLVGHCLVRDN